MPIKTAEEWDADIKAHSLNGRTIVELTEIRDSSSAKAIRVGKDLITFRLFPDAIKREIYESLVRTGEIEEERKDAATLSLANQVKVDDEFQSQLQFYTDKVTRLENFVLLTEKELELREKGLVVRET